MRKNFERVKDVAAAVLKLMKKRVHDTAGSHEPVKMGEFYKKEMFTYEGVETHLGKNFHHCYHSELQAGIDLAVDKLYAAMHPYMTLVGGNPANEKTFDWAFTRINNAVDPEIAKAAEARKAAVEEDAEAPKTEKVSNTDGTLPVLVSLALLETQARGMNPDKVFDARDLQDLVEKRLLEKGTEEHYGNIDSERVVQSLNLARRYVEDVMEAKHMHVMGVSNFREIFAEAVEERARQLNAAKKDSKGVPNGIADLIRALVPFGAQIFAFPAAGGLVSAESLAKAYGAGPKTLQGLGDKVFPEDGPEAIIPIVRNADGSLSVGLSVSDKIDKAKISDGEITAEKTPVAQAEDEAKASTTSQTCDCEGCKRRKFVESLMGMSPEKLQEEAEAKLDLLIAEVQQKLIDSVVDNLLTKGSIYQALNGRYVKDGAKAPLIFKGATVMSKFQMSTSRFYTHIGGVPLQDYYKIEIRDTKRENGEMFKQLVFHSRIHVNKEATVGPQYSDDFKDSYIINEQAPALHLRYGRVTVCTCGD